MPAALGLALWWFNRHGLPISQLASGSQVSAQGRDWSRFLLADGATGWMQLQLVLLLAPAVVLLPACRFTGVRTVYLGVASAGALLMVVVWWAQVGCSTTATSTRSTRSWRRH
ncbi:hypothetical protein GCM10010472_34070 [Pseudonocardia halophobica]|uniref:Uncharacterized protein n=1 Tax=Pseudonocardia halophobica TaxID=29401 RepID=A0A9W6L1S6_9PSEU|nr:hypothetical protein GCM10017577_31870 [Pseudonocardia halophobica]